MMNNTTCPPAEDSTAEKIGKTVALGVLTLMSFVGNSLVILIIYKNRGMRTTTNYFIVSMAMSDVLFTASTMPRAIIEGFSHPTQWFVSGVPGLVLCKFVYFFQDVATAVSILSMVAIAVDRFYGVVYPMKIHDLFTGAVRRRVVFCTWALAVLFHAPYFYTRRLLSKGDEVQCINTWEPAFENSEASKVYFLILSTAMFIFPLALVSVLYSVIIINLKRQKFPGNQSFRNKKRLAQRNKSVLKMVVTVVIVFAICWLPLNVMVYLFIFLWNPRPPCGLHLVNFCVLFLAYSNSSISPGLYFIFSQNFRQGLRNVFMRGTKTNKTLMTRKAEDPSHSLRGMTRTNRRNNTHD